MKKIHFLIVTAAIIFSSCEPTDMTTIVHENGSGTRIFSSKADSAFIAGDTSHNPFPVALTSGWKVTWKYENRQGLNDWPGKNFRPQKNDTAAIFAFATHHYHSMPEMGDSFRFSKDHPWHQFKIIPKLERKFRWFYTYYTYTEIYPKLPFKIKVPFDKYMTADEYSFWLTGSPNLCEGMSGNEANNYTSALEKKFSLWMLQNVWEEQYEELLQHLQHFRNPPSVSKMQAAKDSIFQLLILQSSDNSFELNTASVFNTGSTLNKYFHTNTFSKLDRSDDSIMRIIKNPPALETFNHYNSVSLNYKLLMPGKLLSTNGLNKNDTLVWKIDAFRMLKEDYIVKAESRKLNVLITIISMLFAAAGIVFFVVKRK
ncbi:hypothetical protein [Niabella aquatica]